MTRLLSWCQLFQAGGLLVWMAIGGIQSPGWALVAGIIVGSSVVDGIFGVLTGKSTFGAAWKYAGDMEQRSRGRFE